MVQCELCGSETSSPSTIKTEGAKLDVCSNCTEFGTEVKTPKASSTTSKYSTSSPSSSRSGSSGGSTQTNTQARTGRSSRSSAPDLFDEMDELAQDYDDRIRRGRESAGLSQSELANELNEKASLIRKLERGETLPSDSVQSKLERFLDISLTGEGDTPETSDWEGGSAAGGYTLGDVVKRKE